MVEGRVELEVDVAILRGILRYYFPISENLLFVYVADLSLVVRIGFLGSDGVSFRKHFTHVQIVIFSSNWFITWHNDWRLLFCRGAGRGQEEVFDIEDLMLVDLVPVSHVIVHHDFFWEVLLPTLIFSETFTYFSRIGLHGHRLCR